MLLKILTFITKGLLALTGGVVALIAAAFLIYKIGYPTYSHRYRLTLAIEVDGQVHTGSSVIEVLQKRQPRILPEIPEFAVGIRGQAVLVDLGRHGTVVAALHPGAVQNGSVSAENLAVTAYGMGMRGNDAYPKMADQRGKRALVPSNMPLLIWFSDIANPYTPRVISMFTIPELFGPSARVKEASVEITRDPVVIDIHKKMPWYKALAEQQKRWGVTGRYNEFQLVYNMFVGDD